jgi:acyl carrier protein
VADLRAFIKELIAEVGEIDDPSRITDGAHLYRDLGLDSMVAMELMLEVEQRLGIAISEDALARVTTLSDVVGILEGMGVKLE